MICSFTFYALGLVELCKMSKTIGDLKILIPTVQNILFVRVLLILKPSSFLQAAFLRTVDFAWRRKIGR